MGNVYWRMMRSASIAADSPSGSPLRLGTTGITPVPFRRVRELSDIATPVPEVMRRWLETAQLLMPADKAGLAA